MARLIRIVAVGAALSLGVATAAQARPAAELKCTFLKDIALPHASVGTITTEPLNESARSCRINVTSKPARGEELRIEVWIPVLTAWNGRYKQVAGIGGDPQGLLQANALAGFAGASVNRTKGGTDQAAAEREAREVAYTLISALKGHPPAADPPPPVAKPPPKPPKARPRRAAHH